MSCTIAPLQHHVENMSFWLSWTIITIWLSKLNHGAYIRQAASVPSISNTNGSVSLEIPPRFPDCFPPAPFGSKLADTRDCLNAIMSLPTTGLRGEFHSDEDRASDQFKLPVTRTYNHCVVTVSIRKGLHDECSWNTISNVAGQLASTCSAGYFPNGKSGGKAFTGDLAWIQIIMGNKAYPLEAQDTTGQQQQSATS